MSPTCAKLAKTDEVFGDFGWSEEIDNTDDQFDMFSQTDTK